MLLADYIKAHGYTAAEFAAKLGAVTGEAVRLWAAGRRMPGTEVIERISRITDGKVAVEDLHQGCLIFQKSKPQRRSKKTRAA